MIWWIALLIFVAGCVGGFVNSLVTGELKLPTRDAEAKVYRPGWLGTVVVGGAAAAASWGLYGPLAELALLGVDTGNGATPVLRLSEFFGALIVGFGGGRWLTAELDRVLLSREKEALTKTRDNLATVVKTLTTKAQRG